MNTLDKFINYLKGEFDNKEQIEELKKKGVTNFPFAKHVNNVCNNKIDNLPMEFEGYFLLEESYYEVNGRVNAMPHLFLFTECNNKVKLTSYDLPEGFTKETFKYSNIKENLDYNKLAVSKKFNPMRYEENNNIFHGESISMFTPELKFILVEDICEEYLSVSESFEKNGQRTFGFDYPIIYKRI